VHYQSKKPIIQIKIGGGKSKALRFNIRIACLTTSKALEKSISKHRIYELFSSIKVAWCIKCTKAHVVLPVGRKPNWSVTIMANSRPSPTDPVW